VALVNADYLGKNLAVWQGKSVSYAEVEAMVDATLGAVRARLDGYNGQGRRHATAARLVVRDTTGRPRALVVTSESAWVTPTP